MIKAFKIYGRNDLDEQDPWLGMLSIIMSAARVTYYTTRKARSAQLLFRKDVILPIQHLVDCKTIQLRKQN